MVTAKRFEIFDMQEDPIRNNEILAQRHQLWNGNKEKGKDVQSSKVTLWLGPERKIAREQSISFKISMRSQ